MLYRLLKFPAQLAFLIWCRHLKVNRKELLNAEGPLLIAANHPNSFLDAILLCTLFRAPVHSLARGDVFANKRVNSILRSMNMLPVFRLREGAENLEQNYQTFESCLDIFKKNGIVLIFSEGGCVNEWNLRPLKKGTARLALDAWSKNIPLRIIPLGINYSSFTSFGKNAILNFGNYISREDLPLSSSENFGTNIQLFNAALKAQLEKLVIQIKPVDKKKVKEKFQVPVPHAEKILLFIPAWLGYFLHLPLYFPVQRFTKIKFGRIDHYDSVIVGLLFLTYPFYLLLIALLIGSFFGGYWWALTFVIMPFLAWSRVRIKKQV